MSVYLEKWKNEIIKLAKMKEKDLDENKVNKYLDELIGKKINNRKVIIYNNYFNKLVKTDILALIDFINANKLVISGNGMLYSTHDSKPNILREYISTKIDLRKSVKDKRKMYDKLSDEYAELDRLQNEIKIGNLNSLYGGLGYSKFIFYNLFNAKAITYQSKAIISAATNCFESFFGNNRYFETESEVFNFLYQVHDKYTSNYKNKLVTSVFDNDIIDNIYTLALDRILDRCSFRIRDNFKDILSDIIFNRDISEALIIYYTNNFIEFNKLHFIKEIYKFIFMNMDDLLSPDYKNIKDDAVKQAVLDLDKFYQIFVMHPYQIFDRIRRNMYTYKVCTLYTDTDSDFIGFNRHIQDLLYNTIEGQYKSTEEKFILTAVNILTLFAGTAIENTLYTLWKNSNVPDEYQFRSKMKNEFMMSIILFTPVKKRYASNAILQEGSILANGKGLPELKGFDFLKASVSDTVKTVMTNLCLDILYSPENIRVDLIYRKIRQLQDDIDESLRSGNSPYYKQTEVQPMDHYKIPYSNSGYIGTVIWNLLMPEYSHELPVTVSMVPIKDLSVPKSYGDNIFKNKNIKWLQETYPRIFNILHESIWLNRNQTISHMSIKFIAKPNNPDIPIPDWFKDIVDTEKVKTDTISMFLPILESLGMNMLKTSSTKAHLTNVINL